MTAEQFRKKATHLSLRFFLLSKLPLAFLAGVRVKAVSEEESVTALKFRWINQNPFRSIYFAALHMAAELSTGLLLYQYSGEDKFSMLLLKTEAQFHKKARGTITFTCKQGIEAKRAIKETIKADGTTELVLIAKAEEADNKVVATFKYTWGIKNKA